MSTEILKPSIPVFTSFPKPNFFGVLLLENGAFLLNEDNGYYVIKDGSPLPTEISKPTAHSYTEIIKPT